MFSVFHAIPPSLRKYARASLALTYAICPIFLALSCYALWKIFNTIGAASLSRMDVFHLLALLIVPLVLFLYLAVAAAQRIEHLKLSASYQSRIDLLQKRLNNQEDLLHSVTDHYPGTIVIFDHNNRYWFVNRQAARELGFDPRDIIGKPSSKIIGHDRALKLETRLSEVRQSRRPVEAMDQVTSEHGQVRFVQSSYEIIEPFGDFNGGVLVREEDLTNLIVERERRENMLRQVIATIVAVVDRRDPYASGHSARVGQLARAVAEEMVLYEKQIEAAEIAGSLMNFGKVLVPRGILTKTTPLTPDELQRVRESILTSADILSIIEFTAPVVPTLRQVLERYDGSGVPEGLKGENILITSRIVAVANAFVALVSPRAHRPSMNLKDAMGHMMRDADKAFDPRVVAALANFIDNRANQLDWLTGGRTSQAAAALG